MCAKLPQSCTPWTVAHQAPWSMEFPGKNTGVGCHSLLQWIFLTQGSNPCPYVSCIAGKFFTIIATCEAPELVCYLNVTEKRTRGIVFFLNINLLMNGLAMWHSTQDLSFLTGDGTRAPCSGSTESQPLGCKGRRDGGTLKSEAMVGFSEKAAFEP